MSVVCSNCGEELIGAVNRCWKCGTPFIRSETVRGHDHQGVGSHQSVQLQIPPIRRAPVLAIYLSADLADDEEPIAAIIEDEDNPPEDATSQAKALVPAAKKYLASLPLDLPSYCASAMALLANLICYYSFFGVLLAAIAVIMNVYLLSHRRSKTRWIGFGLAVCALLSALGRTVASLYLLLTGVPLTMALFG